MSHVEQKESIKITVHEAGILPKNVPIVDQYLNNYRSYKANYVKQITSSKFLDVEMNGNLAQIGNVNSCQISSINDMYNVNTPGQIKLH
ncbi:hypothetical protein [Acinetobacter sp. YH01009]|uniref:hypothetical protein n=1 Tax=Acinetobacter TaxID=469 RepID=UPI0015D4308E|nr:hypothetical protein [Acinetobacter sp. YH01009]